MKSRNSIEILSTGLLDKKLITIASDNNIVIDIVPFIHSETIDNNSIKEKITNLSRQNIHVAFTSINAVSAVASLLPGIPNWGIYCIENATLKLILEKFGHDQILGSAPNASALSKTIIEAKKVEKVVFFCGNHRRDELPELLHDNGIPVEEVMVYTTKLTPVAISKKYNGIIFFSPSAVKSFFSINTLGPKTAIFAIGQTTAASIKKYSLSKVIMAERTSRQQIIESLIEHFNK